MEIIKVILTSLISAIALFIIAKMMGRKQISQLDFFDYINGITIGSIAAEMATELEKPYKPLIAMIVYGIISVILSLCANKFMKSRKYINSLPTILLNNGIIYRENLKKAKLDLSEFLVLCRQAGYANICDIQSAIFEFNGLLSVIPKSAKRPLTPEDMNITVDESGLQTEIIMDGIVLHDNLKSLGFDEKWLSKRIKDSGYSNEKEVFFAFCDESKEAHFFPMDK